MEDYKETVRDGVRSVSHVREITRIFQSAPTDHMITHFGFAEKPVTWNTEVFFGGRYVFTYQVDVIVNYRPKKIVRTATEPKFYLNEVTHVANASGDNVTATMGKGYSFGEKEWEKVVGANGNFAVIGIILNTNAPVSGFDDYVRASRRGRVSADP